MDEAGDENPVENIDEASTGGFTEGVGKDDSGLILDGRGIGPEADELAHFGNQRTAFLDSTGVSGGGDGHSCEFTGMLLGEA